MTLPQDTQSHFHQELAELERRVLGIVSQNEKMVAMAVESVVTDNVELADEVISLQGDVHAGHFEVHSKWTELLVRHQPLGSDMRTMTVLIQLNATFERMAAQCGNIAKVAKENHGLPQVEAIVEKIREMGDLVRPMIRASIDSYVRRDLDEARLLPAMDEPIDRLNATMYLDVVAARADKAMLEWAAKMLMVSRAIERIGDQAVDFAEQTAFLITGERAQFDEAGLIRSGSGDDG